MSKQNDNDLGVTCQACGVELTFDNVGGYRTYCDECADRAFEFLSAAFEFIGSGLEDDEA